MATIVLRMTGLEVEALNGAPVFSAWYAGEQRSAADNMDKLLQVLSNQSNRNAQFKTVVTLNLNGKYYRNSKRRITLSKSEKKVSATTLSFNLKDTKLSLNCRLN
jgi:inosine/xanthosine triphosphate pyrophosphatase family protein